MTALTQLLVLISLAAALGAMYLATREYLRGIKR